MSEMIERVARAIFDVWAKDAGLPEDDRDWGEVVRVNHSIVDLARKEARAAIEAMREPTIEMVEVGNESAETCLKDDPCGRAGEHIWADMIDAALKPTKVQA